MPLLAVLDESAHGALDESLKTLYVQNTENKQFYLDIAPDEAAKVAFTLQSQLEAKKTDLKRVHGEKTAMEQRLKSFEGLGKSPDEIKSAMESARPEEVNRLLADAQAKYQADLEALKQSYEEPLSAAKAKAEKLEQEVQRSTAESAIAKLVADFQLDPETAPANLEKYIKAVPREDGSGYQVQVVDDAGHPALVAGQNITPDQLLKGWQEGKQKLNLFLAGKEGGTGAPVRQGGANGAKQYEGLSPVEKLNLAREQGVTTP